MDRRIRRLGIALVLLFARAVRTARVRPGVRGRRDQEPPRQLQPPADRRVQRPARQDPLRRRARCSPRACRDPEAISAIGSNDAIRRATSTGTSPATTRGSTAGQRARTGDEPLPVGRQRRSSRSQRSPTSSWAGQKRGGTIFTTIDPNLQEVARTALGAQPGRGRGDGSSHRRHPGAVLQPGVRPQRALERQRPGDAPRPGSD